MGGIAQDALVVLGGAGDMGSKVVEEIARGLSDDRAVWEAEWRRAVPPRLLIADRDAGRAKDVALREAAMPGRTGIEVDALEVDAGDPAALAEAISGARVLVNCVGPFYRFAQGVLTAALRAGVPYVDICDDDDATVGLLSLDGMARRLGVHALIGMGWTPGISNLLAQRLVTDARVAGEDDLSVAITWIGSAADAAGPAVVQHVFHAITRPVPVFRSGAWITEPAGGGLRDVSFPRPFGQVPAYYTGHPEAVTLPRYLDGLRDVEVRGYLLPADLQNLSRSFIQLGLLDDERRIEGLTGLLHPFLPVLASLGKRPTPALSGVRVDVSSSASTRSQCVIDTMRRLTGIPPAIAALALAGETDLPSGVFAPEGIADPGRILRHLQRRGIEVRGEEAAA